MLKLTILKELHETEAVARKLRPFIDKCDVYGTENGASTIKNAERVEREWKKDLALTHSAFCRVREEGYRGQSFDIRQYGVTRDSFLFKAPKPIYVLERFDDSAAEEIEKTLSTAFSLQAEAILKLSKREVISFMSLASNYLKYLSQADDLRDRNIAQNLLHAESHIT